MEMSADVHFLRGTADFDRQLPPSVTGFSCQPLHVGDRWLPDPRIGIVQRHPMLRMKWVDGWQLKLALGTRSQGCKVVISG